MIDQDCDDREHHGGDEQRELETRSSDYCTRYREKGGYGRELEESVDQQTVCSG